MGFSITKEQQKAFVDEFMKKVLSLSIELVENGKGKESPGETIRSVSDAVINEIIRMGEPTAPPPESLN
jgi:hypothetical protein